MWKRRIAILCIVVFLAGCGSREGVYYPKIDEGLMAQVYNPMALKTGSMLLYHDRIYTSLTHSTDTDRANLRLDHIFEEELGTVQGNHGTLWSMDGEGLSEVTGEGLLYRVKGYDETFRVGLYYEIPMPLADTVYNLVIFEQLNDITLNEGRELFEERLHLEEAVRIAGMEENDSSPRELPPDSPEIQEFLTALYAGSFLDPAGEEYSALNTEESFCLSFYDANDLVTELRVYESGYAVMERGRENIFVLKLEEAACKKVLGAISSPPSS